MNSILQATATSVALLLTASFLLAGLLLRVRAR